MSIGCPTSVVAPDVSPIPTPVLAITSNPFSQSSAILDAEAVITKAPLLWRFGSGSSTFGLAIQAESCWPENEKGTLQN